MQEKKIKRRMNKNLFVFLTSFLVFIIISFIYFFSSSTVFTGINEILKTFENQSVGWRFRTKSMISGYYSDKAENFKDINNGIYKNIYIAGIDDAAIEAFGSWPFNRKVWADMMNSFNSMPEESIPSLVFFDIVFAEPSLMQESDRALIESFKNYKRIAGEDFSLDVFKTSIDTGNLSDRENYDLLMKVYEKEGQNYDSPRIQALKRFELNLHNVKNTLNFPTSIPLMAGIPENLSFVGTANIDVKEHYIMKIPLIVTVNYYRKINGETVLTNVYYPSVILSIAVKLLDSDIRNIITENGFIVIKNALYQGKKTDFKIPVDENLNMKINFKSSPGSGYINTVSLKDIGSIKLPKDSIIFVGMYSKYGAYDIKQSPMGEMYGIELNAYALGTILQRDFINGFPKWLELLYLLILTSFIGFLVSKGTRTTILAGFLSFIIPLGLGLVLFLFNFQIITFIPLLSSILVLLAVQIYIMLTEQKEKRFIKSTFSSYLNPKLVDILIQNPEMIKLGGEDKEVTVFFSSAQGFDDLSGLMPPGEFIAYLNDYFSKMGIL